jgi:hypothetical protein
MKNPKYPIYIPSKGRHETRITMKALDKINVPYKVVVEPSEYDKYASVIDKQKILVLPEDNMKLIGSRNWILQHSREMGDKRHWQFDDNILCFYRLNLNRRIPVGDGTIFRVMEEFVDRYKNIKIAGPNYMTFAIPTSDRLPPFVLNTRVYSMSLVKNDIKHNWRSIYNDDTDICLNVLKDGDCTILFNAFLGDKNATMTTKGGNTEELYLIEDGRLKMAQALADLHPDVCKVSYKFNRPQHHVDYTRFMKYNKLVLEDGVAIPDGTNNFGMVLKRVKDA